DLPARVAGRGQYRSHHFAFAEQRPAASVYQLRRIESHRLPLRRWTFTEHLSAGRFGTGQQETHFTPSASDTANLTGRSTIIGMNAVIACGGTGGHLFPGIAVAEVLRERGHEVLLFVSEKEIDSLALSTRSQFRFEKLPTVAFPSVYSPAIFGFLRRFTESLSRCRSIYQKFKPQIILGMGGFTSTAPILAGRMRGISTLVHESNAVPGKANRLAAKMVRAVLLGFKECAPFFPKARTEVTGTPIRTELKPMDKKIARQKLGLREDLTTLLVMGGSQGASGINQAVIKSLPFLHDVPIQVIHLAGTRDERLVA